MAAQSDKPKAKTSDSMLDTVGTKHIFPFLQSDSFLDGWRFLSKYRNPTWTLNAKGSITLPNLTVIKTPNGLWHLYAQVSLPKMLFGHNARLPNQAEVSEGLKMMSEYTQAKSGLPFDSATATVSLVHFANDFLLSEFNVLPTIYRLSEKTLRNMDKLFYNDSTLYFKSKGRSREIRIYGKFKEVVSRKNSNSEEIEKARGVLRFEHCLLKSYAIDSIVNKLSLPDKTTKSLLNEAVSNFAISEALESLNFYELLSSDKTNLEILLEQFPARKAMNLCGFLEMLNLRGEHFYKDETLGFSKDSYFRDAKDCRKAKVWKQSNSLE